MQDYQERVINELTELQAKYDRLGAFLDSVIFENLDSAERDRLKRQYKIMGDYAIVLSERIENFA